MSQAEKQETMQRAEAMFNAHVSETLPPEVREAASNPTHSNSEQLSGVRQRLAVYQDIQNPQRSSARKTNEIENTPDLPAMTIAPSNPPDSETLPGVKDNLSQWQKQLQNEPTEK
jgi:hypothetical protein